MFDRNNNNSNKEDKKAASSVSLNKEALADVLSQPLMTESIARRMYSSMLATMLAQISSSLPPNLLGMSGSSSIVVITGSVVQGASVNQISMSFVHVVTPQKKVLTHEDIDSPFSGTLRNFPRNLDRPVVPNGEVLWRDKEAKTLDVLQAKYEKLVQDKRVPFYHGLNGGEIFVCTQEVHYQMYKGSENDDNNRYRTNYNYRDWVWELIVPGDILMYVSQKKDVDGEIVPRWIITSTKTGESRIRDLYIASFKLEKMKKDEEDVSGF